ncbi:MAG: 5/3-nucleotidase [Pseudomonadota bacterium]|nr:5/3-nucleotidase [Pseudomonadota bacterium]
MRILLTNDDGYRAQGINQVFHALLAAKHDVVIVAPELNSSGASQSIAVYSPIEIHKVNERIYYVSTTPADSVRLGLQIVYKDQNNYPDLVISGVNLGENVGEDVMYSGTVGAAKEAALHGIPGIAFSTAGYEFNHLDAAARVVVDLIARLDKNSEVLKSPFLWNVNIPNKPYDQIGEFEVTELGKRKPHYPFEKQVTPRGRVIYWQGLPGEPESERLGTDVAVHILQKNISITPLQVLPTDYNQMPVIAALAV